MSNNVSGRLTGGWSIGNVKKKVKIISKNHNHPNSVGFAP